MSELTQRIHRLMTPEAQSSNSREFNVMIGIVSDLREDFRTVADKVDGLRDTVGSLTGDLQTAKAELGHVRGDVVKNCKKIDKLEDGQRKTPSKWSGSFRTWNGTRGGDGGDPSQIVTVLKYVGIAMGSFMVGVGSLVAAWQQMVPDAHRDVTPPAQYAPKYNDLDHNPDTEQSKSDDWETAQ